VDASSGVGIEGVHLLCGQRRTGAKEPAEAREFLSDVDGHFSLAGLETGTWIVLPFHKDYVHPFVGRLFGDAEVDKVAMGLRRATLWKEARALGLAFDVTDAKAPREKIEV